MEKSVTLFYVNFYASEGGDEEEVRRGKENF